MKTWFVRLEFMKKKYTYLAVPSPKMTSPAEHGKFWQDNCEVSEKYFIYSQKYSSSTWKIFNN